MADDPQADKPREPAIPGIPEAVAEPKPRWSLQLIWLIPIVAALIGGWLAAKALLERGPTATISFRTAEGLEAGKTKIKYKNVNIGVVKDIALSQDRLRVVVTAQFRKEAESFLVEDTRFWVVRPRISGGEVSGLGTLFSGSYIGVDIGKSINPQMDFTGLDIPAIVISDLPGRQFVLRGHDLGALEVGTPVYFRRMQVGDVVAQEIDKDGTGVTVKIFVNAPYDRFVGGNTRFWNASGIDVTLDAAGVRVETQSVLSILVGGIAFETPPDSAPEPPAEENTVFNVYPDRALAMRHPDKVVVPFVVYFKESMRGLYPGAPVDFRGVVIGEVKSIGLKYDSGSTAYQFPVNIAIYPERLAVRDREGVSRAPEGERGVKTLDRFVERGFRAQLRTGSVLTGQLYIALDFFPNAAPATVDWTKDPPVLPTVPGTFEEIQATLTNIAKKVDQLPLKEIAAELRVTLQSLTRTMHNSDRLITRLDTETAPMARSAMEEARRTLGTAERVLSADAPMQQDMREALRELTRAAQALRMLADYLERHPESIIHGKKEDEQ
jgi:paraquat-inducible protein B